MQFLKMIGVAIVFLIYSIVGGTFGLFHLAPKNKISATTHVSLTTNTSQSNRGLSISATSTSPILAAQAPGLLGWISIQATSSSQFQTHDHAVYIQDTAIPDANLGSFLLLFSIDDKIQLARDENHVFSSQDGSVFQGLDAQTFTIVGYSTDYGILYAKDKVHVYWFTLQGWGIVQGADRNTIATTASLLPYAKDAEHVYFTDTAVSGADPATFSSFPSSGYAKDKDHVFSHFGYGSFVNLVQGADPLTFSPYPASHDPRDGQLDFSYYGKDNTRIYCQGMALRTADFETFVIADSMDARDKSNTYLGCNIYNPESAP